MTFWGNHLPTEDRERQEIQKASFDESDPEFSLLVPEKQRAIKAIKSNLRTTPAELASASELSINKSSYWLNKIAGETGAKLEVANDGRIFYQFSPNFTSVYQKRGILKAALLAGALFFNLLYWVVRVSFGVALVLSVLIIIAIFVALLVLAIASIFGDSGDSGGGNFDLGGVFSGGGGGFFDPTFLFDIFSWNYSPSHSYYANSLPSTRRDKYAGYVENKPGGNFFLETFSFLFGDGKPNSNLQEIRWQKIAKVIKANGGVVSAEQLAPYLDGDMSDSGMVMNALAQFNGHPQVTEGGFIVYVFPDFLSAVDQFVLPRDSYLEEEEWRFSNFPVRSQTVVLTVAILNFLGSWWLFKHIATIAFLGHLAALIDVLLTYSIILLVIPAVRAIVLVFLNMRITERNERRRIAFEQVSEPKGEILRELQEARAVRDQELQLQKSDKRIVYSSDREALEQEFEQGDQH